MEAHSVDKPIERAAVKRTQRTNRLKWRQRRYGQVCLTKREYEAVTIEMKMLNTAPTKADSELTVQQRIARRMRVSQQWVSELLHKADDIFTYFAEEGIEAEWQRIDRDWQLCAPVEPKDE